MKRRLEGDKIPKKRKKLNNWYEKYIKEKKTTIKSIKDNPLYKVGRERLSNIVDGYMKFNITNYQFKNIDKIAPTSFHLIFPEIFERFKEELSEAVGCSHNKKGLINISDRGVGKTFGALLWVTNLIRICPGPYKIALLGVQLITATNLLYTIKYLLRQYDIKADFDKKPEESVLQLKVVKNGEEIILRCFPGKGDSFRGDNWIKLLIFDEMLFADPKFIEKKVLPHLLRVATGFVGMSTKNSPGHTNDKYLHSTSLMEVDCTTRICKACSERENWEDRKACTHGEPPDAPWQGNDKNREALAEYLDPEDQAAELWGDTFITPDFVLDRDKINDLFNSRRIKCNNFDEYYLSFDANQEGPSENATTIFGALYRGSRLYVTKYLSSFPSNIYGKKIERFKQDLDNFVKKINTTKTESYVFVESNTGNIGYDLKEYVKEKQWTRFIKVVHGKNWDRKLNKFKDIGYAKTPKRTEAYIDNFSMMMDKNIVYFHENILTNTDIPYNTTERQLKKLQNQLSQFRRIKGKITGKKRTSGHDKNDDLGISFIAGLYLPEELNNPSNRLISEKIRGFR
jgi:hypothetical protein